MTIYERAFLHNLLNNCGYRRREDCEQRVGGDDDDDDALDDERVMNVNDGGRPQHPSQRLSCVR